MDLANPEGRVGFLETGKQGWLQGGETHAVTWGPVLGLMLCWYYLEILHDFFNMGPCIFILHWAQNLYIKVCWEDQGVRGDSGGDFFLPDIVRIPEGELGKECVDPLEEHPAFVGTYSLDSNYRRWDRSPFPNILYLSSPTIQV